MCPVDQHQTCTNLNGQAAVRKCYCTLAYPVSTGVQSGRADPSCPSVLVFQVDDDDEGDAGQGKSRKVKKKAAYAGGLVLEPKVGKISKSAFMPGFQCRGLKF